ncbi:MAG: beta-3-deoxy-D-manno-oct-2-ulosonic acid transferase [Gammaproteobacteria bacterium]|nr:MAG: beta-3-deoxy-D-manno-oct-2-ulosonic acid transferase [Gammaproteobacteria bacterium]
MTFNLNVPSKNQLKLPSNLAVVGKGMITNNDLLAETLESNIVRWYPWSLKTQGANLPSAFIGWGRKKSYDRAFKASKLLNTKVFSVEDGFLRSLYSGINSRHAVSLVVDDLGIYFDLKNPSRLEQLITQKITQTKDESSWSEQHKDYARYLIEKIISYKLSKYNETLIAPNLSSRAGVNTHTSHILLVDQVLGDASIKGAGADKQQFKNMLKDACRNHPNAHIWIKAHPAGKKGYLTQLTLPKKHQKRIHILTEIANPIALLQQIDAVYTVSSHMGFEALLLNKTVYCYGVSWYTGWGLTEDSKAPKKLLKKVKKRRNNLLANYKSQQIMPTIEQLFFAAYIDYSKYVDPASGLSCEIEVAINWLITNARWGNRLQGNLTIYEFSRWKLPFVNAFIGFSKTQLFIKPKLSLKNFVHPNHNLVNNKSPLLVWGLTKRLQVSRLKDSSQVYCMEDGFIRSNGLGTTLLAPLSVVLDKQGIYYNATEASDLEDLLKNCQLLTKQQTVRAENLHQYILDNKVSKYNVGKKANVDKLNWLQTIKTTKKNKILIVGQVEDDLSVKFCGSHITKNAELIKRVRIDNPHAYLVYKPHPDIEAGLRIGKVDKATLSLVDAVAYDVAMPDCLALIDEVHTISSLTGFEALLRGKKVSCYGLPFYAGWGLTNDMDSDIMPKVSFLKRRARHVELTLNQLIYCTLIEYPLYRLPGGYGLAQVEQVIDYLYKNEDSQKIRHKQKLKSKLIGQSKLRFMQMRNRIKSRR